MPRSPVLFPENIKEIRRKIKVMSPKVQRVVKGKGFSRGEILAAGISIEMVKKLGIPFDRRRKTTYDFNINLLKNILQKFSAEQLVQYETMEKTVKREAESIMEVPEKTMAKGEEINIDNVCDNLIGAIESAKRKKKETLFKIFKEDMSTLSDKLGLNLTDDEISSLFETILKDLALAGYGKLTNKFFSRSDEWDSTLAREIILDRIKKIIDERR